MANTLLTIDMITREAIPLFVNTNEFMMAITREYDASFGVSGAKIGSSLRLRLPLDYVVTNGPALSAQDSVEQSTTLTLATQRHVDLTFSSAEEVLKVDDYNDRFLMPAMNNLAGNVAGAVMAGSEGNVANIIGNFDGNGASGSANNIITPSLSTIMTGRALLAQNSTPGLNRQFVLDPITMAKVTSSLTGLLNPATAISKQYQSGMTYSAGGFTWMEDQTSIKHTTGSFTAGTLNGAALDGQSTLVTNAITGTLKAGDIITIAGMNGVNRVTKQTVGTARQFVVTADVATLAIAIPIYPTITSGGPSYNSLTGDGAQQYQTVDALAVNGAAITLYNKPSEVYRKNIQFAPKFVTMVTADLQKPPNTECSRKVYDNVAMRILRSYIPGTDQTVTRCDILFGFKYIRPEWAVIIPDAI